MKVLVVVDMQNDFIDGTLGTSEAVKIIDFASVKIDTYIQNGDMVVYTQDTHDDLYLSTLEGKKLPIIHCVRGTSGWNISEKIYRESCPIIEKNSFGSLDVATYLKTLENTESIEFIGLCTDVCIISNVLITKAKMPEIPIIVDASCCAGSTIQGHQSALCAMKSCQIDIIGE